jgi:hypothetical protein
MHKISKLMNYRADNVRGGSARMMGRWGILGGLLFFALFFNSVPAFGAAPSAGPMVTLEWNPSLDPNVVGYNIYCGGASGVYTNVINAGNATNAPVYGLAAGLTYYFAATAYDNLGQQSAYSSEISVAMPAAMPAVQLRSAPAGQLILTLSGPPGCTYDILASPDFMTWTIIAIVTTGNSGSLNFTDTNAANFPQRFYRTQEIP